MRRCIIGIVKDIGRVLRQDHVSNMSSLRNGQAYVSKNRHEFGTMSAAAGAHKHGILGVIGHIINLPSLLATLTTRLLAS